RLVQVQDEVRGTGTKEPDVEIHMPPAEPHAGIDTAVPADTVQSLDTQLHHWPDDFSVNPKLGRQLERRAKVVPGNGNLDWAHAEALAFGSLLADGVPIRLTGQDVERGTFSQRHLVLHDVETNRMYTPLANLEQARAPIVVHNSPLSELAALGFEYGFSVVAPKALVLWEAQFGDFVNGAQVIIDQFLAAGREKWRQESRLVLLLPHGYEGQGPEHSSARLERFLQLAGEGNIRVANCTTPAQYFHLLRRQALLDAKRPLSIMTPKSLLRHPKAVSKPAELSDGGFRFVIDDDSIADRSAVERVVACSGKVYYDLLAQHEELGSGAVALVRVELLYPFPGEQLSEVLAGYPNARELMWTQEEPENMGAWRFIEPRLREIAGDRQIRYNGRPERASPAEGYLTTHESTQRAIVQQALTVDQRPRRTAARKRA
ncbi:MAG: 2-oxoglutarate dehydrogenase E1 component, partial [Longimicrobiales bacterium]